MSSTLITILSTLVSLLTLAGLLYKPFKKWNEVIVNVTEYKNSQELKLNELTRNIESNHSMLTNSLQDDYKKLHDKFNEISDEMKENRLSVLRVELNQLMHTDADNVDTICKLFDEYKAIGGNKYMDMKFNKWKKERGF